MSDRVRLQPGDEWSHPTPVREHRGKYMTSDEYAHEQALAEARKAEKARRSIKRDVDEEEQSARQLVVTSANEIVPETTRWLWTPYGDCGIPLGDLSVLVGKGGAAKSQILCWFCARVSTGTLEGCLHGTPSTVIYLYKEDSVSRTIVPRLMAAGADRDRVKFLRVTYEDDPNAMLRLPDDLDLLAAKIRQLNASLVVYDPLSSHLAVRDSNSASVMRGVYERIRQMHEDTDTTGLGLGHLRKQPAGNLLDAFMGSSEQGNVVRNGWGVCERTDAEDMGEDIKRYVMSQEKNNLAPHATSLTYHIEAAHVQHDMQPITTQMVVFDGQSQETVSDILRDAMTPGYTTKVDEAVSWLRDHLTDEGEVPVRQLGDKAKDEKINFRTLQRAAVKVNVISNRHGAPGHWTYTWTLPSHG